MRHPSRLIVLTLTVAFLLIPLAALSLDAGQQKEFDRISRLNMSDLTREAARLLDQKYPSEDWDSYRFPSYVFSSDSVETGYKIAAKEPELLGNPDIAIKEGGIPCYCFCDAMGHQSLLHCFWKNGKAGEAFDDHAADCNICYGQAMLAFLWSNLGATEKEILIGMEKRFSHLPKPNPH